MRHCASVEMVAGECDRSGQRAATNHVVDRERQRGALAMAEPADAGRQALERNVSTRQRDPIGENAVVRKGFEQMVVDLADVFAVVGERNPAERTDRARKQRAQIGFGENLDFEGVDDAAVARLRCGSDCHCRRRSRRLA